MSNDKHARALHLGAVLFSALMLGTSAQAQELLQAADNPPPKIVPVPSAKPSLALHFSITAGDFNRMEGVIAEQARRLDEQDHRLELQNQVIQALLQQMQNLQGKPARAKSEPAVADASVAAPQVEKQTPTAPIASAQKTEDRVQAANDLEAIRAGGLPGKSIAAAAGTAPILRSEATPAVQAAAPAAVAPSLATVPAAPRPFIVAQQQQQQQRLAAQATPAGQQAPAAQQMPAAAPGMGMLPMRPVGEAPPDMPPPPEVIALPEGARVLTPVGRLVLDTSVDYGRTSSNRLVFRGVEIVPGIQLGLVDANDVARDTVGASFDGRYGLFDRLEVNARVPFIYRHDRITVLQQQVNNTTGGPTVTTRLDGRGIGDVEFGARYQVNRGTANSAVYVAGLTIKTPTGKGPYSVNFDSSGAATELGTGSGFWAASPTLSILFPSDPVVLFANVGYLHSIPKTFNQVIGKATLGRVAPGDSFSFGMGFGFALNPQFSFSLGFANSYLLRTATTLNSTKTHSSTAEVAILTMGWSYVFSPRFTLSSNFEFGMTSDAPDMHMSFRFPFTL